MIREEFYADEYFYIIEVEFDDFVIYEEFYSDDYYDIIDFSDEDYFGGID